MVGMTNDWGIDENNVKTIGKGGVQYIHTLWKAFKQKNEKNCNGRKADFYANGTENLRNFPLHTPNYYCCYYYYCYNNGSACIMCVICPHFFALSRAPKETVAKQNPRNPNDIHVYNINVYVG